MEGIFQEKEINQWSQNHLRQIKLFTIKVYITYVNIYIMYSGHINVQVS